MVRDYVTSHSFKQLHTVVLDIPPHALAVDMQHHLRVLANAGHLCTMLPERGRADLTKMQSPSVSTCIPTSRPKPILDNTIQVPPHSVVEEVGNIGLVEKPVSHVLELQVETVGVPRDRGDVERVVGARAGGLELCMLLGFEIAISNAYWRHCNCRWC